jgi:hypothetical protein
MIKALAIATGIAAMLTLGACRSSNGGTSGSDSNYVTQSYWYCWDSGPPSPHHLGHSVSGDHLCTNAELGR